MAVHVANGTVGQSPRDSQTSKVAAALLSQGGQSMSSLTAGRVESEGGGPDLRLPPPDPRGQADPSRLVLLPS